MKAVLFSFIASTGLFAICVWTTKELIKKVTVHIFNGCELKLSKFISIENNRCNRSKQNVSFKMMSCCLYSWVQLQSVEVSNRKNINLMNNRTSKCSSNVKDEYQDSLSEVMTKKK